MTAEIEMQDLGMLLQHYQTDDIYIRVLTIPKGKLVAGHRHLTNHLNILLEGSMAITIGCDTKIVHAPYIFEALKDSVKVVKTFTDCSFANIHATKGLEREELVETLVDTKFSLPNIESTFKQLETKDNRCHFGR